MEGNNGTGEGEDVRWAKCGYLKRVSWSDRGGCKHVNDFIWCGGCPERYVEEAITIRKGGRNVDKSGC